MSRSIAAVGVVMVLSLWPVCAASGASHTPILYRTIEQDRTGWLTFLPDNHTLICGHRDGTASEYDIRTGKMGVEINFGMNAHGYARGGQWLYTVSTYPTTRGMIEGINAKTLEQQGIYNHRAPDPESLWASSYSDGILVKSWPGHGGSHIYNGRNGKVLAHLRDLPAGAAFSPNLQQVAYRRGRNIIVASTYSGAIRHRIPLEGVGGASLKMAFSPDGRTLAVTSENGMAYRRGTPGFTYALATGTREWIHTSARGADRVAWSPTGRWMVISAANRDLAELVDPRTGRQIGGFSASPPDSTDEVQGMAFSRNNRWMAICSSDGEIKVYQLPR